MRDTGVTVKLFSKIGGYEERRSGERRSGGVEERGKGGEEEWSPRGGVEEGRRGGVEER